MRSLDSWPGAIYDHYAKFLGQASGRQVFEFDGGEMSLQVLQFQGVFPECTVFTTVGFGKYFAEEVPPVELLVVVDWGENYVPEILALATFYLMYQKVVPHLGMTTGGISELSPEFARATGKDGFVYMKPFPLPDDFEWVDVDGERGRVLMALFIAKSEREFLRDKEVSAIADLFDGLDLFDVRRPAAI